MNKYYSLVLACLALFTGSILWGQSTSSFSAITPEVLSAIQENTSLKGSDVALQNAITNNDIKKLSLNHSVEGKVNNYFSHQVKTKGIANQKSSGRCWLYTGLNTLKPLVQEKYKIYDFDFSHTYNFFWDQLEKANLFLNIAIATARKPLTDREVEWLFKNPIGDGGQWTTFADNVAKYGLVPAEVMPDTYQSENTSMISRLLSRKLREDGLKIRQVTLSKMSEKAKEEIRVNMLSDIYRMLVLALGEPPTEFTWQFKDADGNISQPVAYTPLTFYQEVIGIDLSDYVMFMNDPSRDYGKLYEIEYDRNLAEGNNWRYVNLEIGKVKEFAKRSILDNQAMYFSCDVGKQLDLANGLLDPENYNYNDLFGVDFSMEKAQRIATFESGSTHGMALVGLNVLSDGSVDKWQLENSWGADKGDKGYLTMTDAWFDEYMFRIIINKKYIDEDVLKILDQKPVMLPPWDPMFTPEP